MKITREESPSRLFEYKGIVARLTLCFTSFCSAFLCKVRAGLDDSRVGILNFKALHFLRNLFELLQYLVALLHFGFFPDKTGLNKSFVLPALNFFVYRLQFINNL